MSAPRAKLVLPCLCAAVVAAALTAGDPPATWWGQWGRTGLHQGFVPVAGQTGSSVLANIVYDPFTSQEQVGSYAAGDLLVHYQTPLLTTGGDVFMECKTGQFTNIKEWQRQTWCEQKFTWQNGVLTLAWTHINDWKPVPFSADKDGPGWEPVYHGVLTNQGLWVPGFEGAAWKLDRDTGSVLAHVTPFGPTLDPNTYAVGPLSTDRFGNIFYNVMQLDGSAQDPWLVDVPHSWLVKVTAAGQATAVPWASLVPGTPAATDSCIFRYSTLDLPWPVLDANGNPAPTPTLTCGSQRPPVNTAPAIGPDGTIYDISRASFDDYYGYVVAINPNLTPKW